MVDETNCGQEGKVFDSLSGEIIGCAIEVHRTLGPGLLESSYHGCLSHELRLRGIDHRCEKMLPIHYKGLSLDCGYRVDLIVGSSIIVELKSVRGIDPIHEAQILTYMKLSGIRIGLILNFNVLRMRDGIRRYVL